ncbi:MAG: tRNA preQ1(34) S-adenosylmethionine ribosyltransferase-isomerase QueA [Spirochaetia bacterium]
MKTKDFSFDLPQELIAQRPADRRENARLFVLDRANGARHHDYVAALADYLTPGSLLVLNDARVRKARFETVRVDTGGVAEFLLVEQQDDYRWWAITDKAKRARRGVAFRFPEDRHARVVGEERQRRLLEFDTPVDETYIERTGRVPLPPYIRRTADSEDDERYQTVYARTIGSVAAPTAGLHFSEELFQRLADRGVETTTLTLHVGIGTFAPVRTEEVEDHDMHSERFEISRESAEAVNRAKRDGRPVVAVGTTSVRAMEGACAEPGGTEQGGGEPAAPQTQGARGPSSVAELRPGTRETSIFMYPGYRFRVVDQLFTNFHTPESTLLMLVSAFAGRERILDAYREAVFRGYRFFSYGDAMLIR